MGFRKASSAMPSDQVTAAMCDFLTSVPVCPVYIVWLIEALFA